MLTRKILAISVASILAESVASPACAANDPNTNQQLQQLIKQFNHQMSAMQNQMNNLQSEVVELKSELHQERAKHGEITQRAVRPPAKNTRVRAIRIKRQPSQPQLSLAHNNHDNTVPHPPNLDHNLLPNPANILEHAAIRALYIGGMAVLSSPYIGSNSSFDGSDLMVNAPSVNLDVRLLKQQQVLQNAFLQSGFPLPTTPIIQLSGKIEAQAITNNVGIGGTTTSTFELSAATLELFAEINPCVAGFIALHYDNSATPPSTLRVTNSNVYLDQAFITIGNLNVSPFYTSFGQLYFPFGQYSSYFLTTPLTDFLGRIQQRGIVIGARPDSGFYGSGYLFQNAANINGRVGGGGNLGYRAGHGPVKLRAEVGVVSSLAESNILQGNHGPESIPFSGFSFNDDTEQLHKAVPGLDLNAELDVGAFSLISEYVAATTSFERRDLSFNCRGAKPSAFHVEGVYTFDIHGRPSTFALGYDYSSQALALLIPRYTYEAVFNVSIWRDTIASLEFQHARNYGVNDFARGANSLPFRRLYDQTNMLMLQFGIYF